MAVRRGLALMLTLAGLATLGWAQPASATFHLMSVREVATDPAGANSSYIELQMYAPVQNFVNGHAVTFYTGTGSLLATFTLTSNVPNGNNQDTILIGDTATAGSPDFTYDQLGDAILTYGPGGAACWDTVDCVSWGSFTGDAMLPSRAGTPAPAIGVGQALQRSITPGCATLLEAGDDTNVSSTDFSLVTPAPRNNTVTPTETTCNGGGGGGGDTKPPQTTITKQPKAKTTKTTAKFKFMSSEQGSSFRCKLDKGDFEGCNSGKVKYKHLDPGKHKFQVVATDAAGNADKTPAKAKFKVLEKG
ncbi:MAG: hypothetical protein QOI10_1343 [Solirubrobacterales bacterium]|jgi:hypothetical protein|nr:hypothetical protein [Solirubrobacterales bacterium]